VRKKRKGEKRKLSIPRSRALIPPLSHDGVVSVSEERLKSNSSQEKSLTKTTTMHEVPSGFKMPTGHWVGKQALRL